jgi:hypothetical protein
MAIRRTLFIPPALIESFAILYCSSLHFLDEVTSLELSVISKMTRLQNTVMQQPVALLLATIATILIYTIAFGNLGKPSKLLDNCACVVHFTEPPTPLRRGDALHSTTTLLFA